MVALDLGVTPPLLTLLEQNRGKLQGFRGGAELGGFSIYKGGITA